MRILQYNIWNGCRDDPDRLARLGAWLGEHAYDVVGLNELDGWDAPPGLPGRGRAWGYPHAALGPTGHSTSLLGVLARHPIRVLGTHTHPFHHGVLHVAIRGVQYLITHLTPVDAAGREREAAALAALAAGHAGPVVVMGDLNTLSPLDAPAHAAAGLAAVLQEDATLRRKFLTADGLIDYRPMRRLLAVGLHDPGAAVAGDYTVPTPVNDDTTHAARMRLDYVLVNAALLAHAPTVRTLRGREVDALSDHYPVECTWDEEAVARPRPPGA